MFLEDERRGGRGYDWSGRQARRRRMARTVLAACVLCAAGYLLIASGYLELPPFGENLTPR